MKRIVLAILDGFGLAHDAAGNAITRAHAPFLHQLMASYPCSRLTASGMAVGLPEGQIGNSEVGHLAIGAGRTVYTGLSLINHEVEAGLLANNQAFKQAIAHADATHSNVHLFGLLSAGGVHSHEKHIFALIRMLASAGARVVVHVFGDGRDVPPGSLPESLRLLNEVCAETGAKIGSVSGRYYAMDRDQNFERTLLAYDAMVKHEGASFTDAAVYVEHEAAQGRSDEFIMPAFASDCAAITAGDSIIFANYRPDRARQLSHLFTNSTLYPTIKRQGPDRIFFTTMMTYEGVSCNAVAYPPVTVSETMGEIVATAGLHQARIAETEKYAHVTFFMDGGAEKTLAHAERILLPTTKVATYDLNPAMEAKPITDAIIDALKRHDLIIANYANPDMVGHTGNLEAAKLAIAALDQQLARLHQAAEDVNALLIITSDHGNAEVMIDASGNPATMHTTNPVPFIIAAPGYLLRAEGTLADVAPTVLTMLNLKPSPKMTGRSLLQP